MDDLGMAESTVSAYHALLDAGLLSAASVMMPCSWSPGAITAASSRPGSDVGVHLTLNSEWETCRWRPLLGSQAAELVDGESFLHRRVEDARRAGADVVARETRLQLEAALGAGLDVTHLDTHRTAAVGNRQFDNGR
ncbi:ChbG/HpnK family deacetylase [Deinococcus cavernae]|uniref:ChbG/HpnK family deacetylase n=1 Tax=Deinococcus cavernae TaxID=2320857 RepID=A0A418VGI3_9DEIO|nr:ChbG/HpnK family deacetylase [Deinococcus cavernae]RJF75198.1 ChbG/HpnK family deacetylase [Deinococcus cavernae]